METGKTPNHAMVSENLLTHECLAEPAQPGFGERHELCRRLGIAATIGYFLGLEAHVWRDDTEIRRNPAPSALKDTPGISQPV
jgi:hypothetical protein